MSSPSSSKSTSPPIPPRGPIRAPSSGYNLRRLPKRKSVYGKSTTLSSSKSSSKSTSKSSSKSKNKSKNKPKNKTKNKPRIKSSSKSTSKSKESTKPLRLNVFLDNILNSMGLVLGDTRHGRVSRKWTRWRKDWQLRDITEIAKYRPAKDVLRGSISEEDETDYYSGRSWDRIGDRRVALPESEYDFTWYDGVIAKADTVQEYNWTTFKPVGKPKLSKLKPEGGNPVVNTKKNIAIILSAVKTLLRLEIINFNRYRSWRLEERVEDEKSYKLYSKIIEVLENPKSKEYPKLLTEDEIKRLTFPLKFERFREKYEDARKDRTIQRAPTLIKKKMTDYYYRPDGPYSKKMLSKYGNQFAKGTRKRKPKKKPKRKPMRQKKKQTTRQKKKQTTRQKKKQTRKR